MRIIANYQELCVNAIAAGVRTGDIRGRFCDRDGVFDPQGDYIDIDVSVNPDSSWGWMSIKAPVDFIIPDKRS